MALRVKPTSANFWRVSLSGSLILFATAIMLPRISAAAVNRALWVANGTNVLEFGPGSLLTSGINGNPPRLTLNSATGFGAPEGVVFSSTKDLWVIDGGTTFTGGTIVPALDEFTPAQLGSLEANPTPAPNVALTSSALVFPQRAVFDTAGNLWVSDYGAGAVYVFTTAQLAAGGAQTPTVTITSSPAFTGPAGIVFGANGNLWIANLSTSTLFEFNAASLPQPTTVASVTLTPDVILSDDGNNSIQGPSALAFDSARLRHESESCNPALPTVPAEASATPAEPGATTLELR